ncbi:NAD(P)-dependent dehydrogenase (short-subunit alcohol dehydrogenase family) [Paenibacillus amylolyticus]|uniref:NAD(P)-dependent dehydrogenase (Short-subunit alcohol dehydrogenase family) n=1 Tax=Paenibacillus amylolyticus TaxID=1451 RepID=A0AAP5H192_PAEAM|nr:MULTISPECIES: SDR family oxidoreductase [Paenibacillus]MDR6724449.1 NAD(P)-dependent dehydrogenase (short-subunit alcohol dehydrogenase family) [Paenibacillus amylolyticus]
MTATMTVSMKDKVVIVTGAKGGIGLATAQLFAKEGASVALVDINEPKQEAQDLIDAGYQAISIQCDVSNERSVESMVEKTVATFGKLDYAYNNAGIQNAATDTVDLKEDVYDDVMNVNTKGIWLCMKHELLQLRKQGTEGAIVNCSSMGGLIGVPERSVYHASKHGVLGLTKSTALEYASKGIRINAVCPGIIETPMVENMLATESDAMDELMKQVPIGRLAKPEEVASVVLWLCSSSASYVIGQAISVDGGYTVQ